VRSILIDAGPLIALFDKSDSYHKRAIAFIKTVKVPVYTTWPVITEALHMLDFSTQVQLNLLTWIERGGLNLIEISEEQLFRIIELTQKFDDVPMDLADATLIVASELKGIRQIASVDGDFYIYRDIRNRYLSNIFMES